MTSWTLCRRELDTAMKVRILIVRDGVQYLCHCSRAPSIMEYVSSNGSPEL